MNEKQKLSFHEKIHKVDKYISCFQLIYIILCFVLGLLSSSEGIIQVNENSPLYKFLSSPIGMCGLVLLLLYQGFKSHASEKHQIHENRIQISLFLFVISVIMLAAYYLLSGYNFLRIVSLFFGFYILGWLLKEEICYLFNRE